MVGVPHSTGCSLCRDRHIKCDEAVPECTQCQRYGRTCPGYRRTFRFQDEGPILARRHRGPRRRGRGASTGPTTPSTVASASTSSSLREPLDSVDSSDSVVDHEAGVAVIVRDNAIALMRRHSASVSLDESVSPSLVRKTFQAAQPQLFLDFISASFPTLYFHNHFRAGSEPGFAEFIVLNFGQDAFMDSAICCLSSVYLAHLTQDPVLLRTSRRMYGLSLQAVVRALNNPDRAMSDNMVCTAMMLSVFEMYAQTSPGAWVIHSDAVKRLMMSRRPALHESGFGRSCYIAFRGFHVATAVYQGTPCFLDREEWQNYARRIMAEDAQKPGEWSAYAVTSDEVFMEIVKCPRYISESQDILSGRTEWEHDSVEALLQRINNTSRKLHNLNIKLRACISAHGQRQQGIVRRPESFVGPVPEIFPETGPSLLLRGSESILETLGQLHDRIEDQKRSRTIEELSPDSPIATPSDASVDTPSPPATNPRTFTLPFRIYSELGRGPSQTSDRNDPRAVIWLDRVASSMGMMGVKLLTDSVACVEEDTSAETSESSSR
ncbi:hypothetical protein N7509_010267 [Penicillium cosmopolitanum]|uniref:Zn(2)-C6 fungal-type domain-containing protein n=1 Tax=Penicillium cosmopolitanum TaxID=1131564 RepID=A0A9X0B4H3_9EURO|nr:uncharacterized protein N7509_010267 [Penicillium cosmopolitanum]KAJ5387726.1 hypothetical protein N7509_010267 [Penicillium cosmopolitanum]